MENGWIKLYRKIVDSDIFQDEKALKVFIWLLVKVDKTTGEKKIARSWTSQELRMNPSTFYKVLQRIVRNYKMVTAKVTAKYTIISLINWRNYQSGNSISNSKVTREGMIGNTLQEEEKNKNRERASQNYLLNIPLEDIKEFMSITIATENQIKNKGETLYDYCEAKGKKYKNYKAFLRNALRRDYQKKSILDEKIVLSG